MMFTTSAQFLQEFICQKFSFSCYLTTICSSQREYLIEFVVYCVINNSQMQMAVHEEET